MNRALRIFFLALLLATLASAAETYNVTVELQYVDTTTGLNRVTVVSELKTAKAG